MKHITKKASAAGLATVVALVGLGASGASAAGDHAVYKSDFIAGLSDTRETGAFGFGPKGLVLRTASNTSTDKVAEYFTVGGADGLPLSGINDVEYDWSGSDPSPGAQYVMDFDNDGSLDGILVGEKVYGGQDVWLTNGSKPEYKGTGAPSNTGGSGTDNHGTLSEWSEKYPDAVVESGGFSLGSGIKGDGVLKSISYGADKYVFTETVGEKHSYEDLEQHSDDDLEKHNEGDLEQHSDDDLEKHNEGDLEQHSDYDPEKHSDKDLEKHSGNDMERHQSNAKPTGSFVWSNRNRLASVQLRTNALPANNRGGAEITWSIKVQGAGRFSSDQGFGKHQNFRWTFSKKGGSKKVQILRDGVVVSTRFVTTK